MSLISYNPSRELFRMEKDFNRLLKNFFTKFKNDEPDKDFLEASWAPLSDIVETDKEYKVVLDLPGVDKKDIKVSLNKGVLSISGERKEEKEVKNSNYYKIERAYGKYYRSFVLPENIDESMIDAEFKNGTLTVHIAKTESAQPKQIEVKVK